MAKIEMRVTTPASPDGIKINNYVAGREYDVNDSLAKTLVSLDVADYVRIRRKDAGIAPENKAVESSSENKATEPDVADNDVETDVINEDETIDEATDIVDSEDSEKEELIRVYQLADELNTSSKEILKAAKKLDIFAKAPASGLSKSEREEIKAYFAKRG